MWSSSPLLIEVCGQRRNVSLFTFRNDIWHETRPLLVGEILWVRCRADNIVTKMFLDISINMAVMQIFSQVISKFGVLYSDNVNGTREPMVSLKISAANTFNQQNANWLIIDIANRFSGWAKSNCLNSKVILTTARARIFIPTRRWLNNTLSEFAGRDILSQVCPSIDASRINLYFQCHRSLRDHLCWQQARCLQQLAPA